MGQKVHPYGFRLGIVTDWKSRWYSDKDYATNVAEDYRIRSYLRGELKRGAISRIDIERIGDKKVQIDIHTGRPGVVIGRGGAEAERLRSGLEDLSGRRVKFNVVEVHNAELDATLLARSVADQLEGRVSFRRALKRTVATALKAGAEGVRVQASGRLGGADMGRREWYLEGRVPLHTLRADIDFGQATASTTVGAIGVKVWVYKGDVMARSTSAGKAAAEARLAAGGRADRKRRKSVKSRAEAAAGQSDKRIIEAGGGKRVIEAGGGKRPGGKRLIEAGGGKKVTAADASAELAEDREAVAAPATDAVAPSAVGHQPSAEEVVGEAAATEAVVEEAAAEAVAETVSAEAVAEVAVKVAEEAESAAEETVEVAKEAAEEAADASEGAKNANDSGEEA
ncbi:SSU ribosomal protein S3p (S3e) [hydrothermal vent metagenome]|uniref:SSU ribosomal protein S3p (S3e) n=1 Tax=hydrothermal vent metagenome TaxID=652676 RepID=A0A3B0SJQ0_9ZZZZ